MQLLLQQQLTGIDGVSDVDAMKAEEGVEMSDMNMLQRMEFAKRRLLEKQASQLFNKPIEKLTSAQASMCNMYLEFNKLQRMVESMLPRPFESVFLTTSMDKKLDYIYQKNADETTKLNLDKAHKPYFVYYNPYVKEVFVNGVERTIDPESGDEEYVKMQKKELYENEMSKSDANQLNMIYEMFHDENYKIKGLQWCPLQPAMIVYIIIVVCITLSVCATMLGSVSSLSSAEGFFDVLEAIVTIIFTVEYCIKLLVVRDRVNYALDIMNLLDLFAILPFYVTLFLPKPNKTITTIGGVLRAVRLTRIAKIRQLATPYTTIILSALMDSVRGTGSVIAIFLFIACVFCGTLVYAAESASEEGNELFLSIPSGMWYALVTMSTVGYGDLYPTSTVGLFFGVLTITVGTTLSSLIIMVIGQYYMNHETMYNKGRSDIKQLLYDYAEGETTEQRLNAYYHLLQTKSSDFLYSLVRLPMRIVEEKKGASQEANDEEESDDEVAVEDVPVGGTTKE